MAESNKTSLRTVDVPQSEHSLVKPAELVGFKEVVPLTLQSRKAINLMLAAAWDNITDATREHRIPISELTTTDRHHKRVVSTMDGLFGAVVQVALKRDGKDYVSTSPIFAKIDRPVRGDGYVYYKLSDTIVAIISESVVYTRLTKQLMLNFQSKYALTLWETIERVRRKKWQTDITMTVDEWRDALGVDKGKVPRFANFKQKVFDPAVAEVNQLSEYKVEWKPNKDGRSVVEIRVEWVEKTQAERLAAYREIEASKIGRKARRTGTTETVVSE